MVRAERGEELRKLPIKCDREESTGVEKSFLKNCIESAGVAQLVEQLICNQPVGGSSPFTSSVWVGSEVVKRN